MSSRTAGPSTQTLRDTLLAAQARLAESSSSARLDAEVLVAHALDLPRHAAYSHPERTLDRDAIANIEALVGRRAAGEPVAHLVGQREFWSMTFAVTRDTLVPRPETEHLVEQALHRLPDAVPCSVLDAGTGAGAIAIAIASERPHAQLWASDTSTQALVVARSNARRLAPGRIRFCSSNWFARFVQQRFSMIVSNPPYVDAGDRALGEPPLVHEPHTALASGPEGLDAISHIVSHARTYLEPDGWLLLEHGSAQGARVRKLLATHGFGDIETTPDLAGHERVTAARN